MSLHKYLTGLPGEWLYPVGRFYSFPKVDWAFYDGDWIISGGTMDPGFVLSGYISGFFPWFSPDCEIEWWNPKERMVLCPSEMHLSKRMRRTLKSGRFSFKMDTDFETVMYHCATSRGRDKEGTWISDPYYVSYGELFKQGIAHCVEVYEDSKLVGGLYGLLIGDVFCGESMFSLVSDSSKAAFWYLCQEAERAKIKLIDCQMYTDHLASLGAYVIARKSYLEYLSEFDDSEQKLSDSQKLAHIMKNRIFAHETER